MKITKKQQLELERIAASLKLDLARYYAQWELPLRNRIVMLRFLRVARRMKLTLNELAALLESLGAFKIAYDMTGVRYFFPANLDQPTIDAKMLDVTHEKEQQRQLRKRMKHDSTSGN